MCVPQIRNGGLDRGHCMWTEVLWPWQISSSVPVICGHQALNLYAWTLNMYICWWTGQRMLDTWVCAGECCNAVFFPNVIRNLGGMKDTNILKLLSYYLPVDGPCCSEFTNSFKSEVNLLLSAVCSSIHLMDMWKVCVCERGRLCVCVCICVSMCVSGILHLS